MTLDWWLLFLLASLAISLTPGPNALLALDHGARFGIRHARWTVAGSLAGLCALLAAAMAGLGALLAASEALFTAVKWIGAAYLCWLGIALWRSPGLAAPAAVAAPRGRARAFAAGFAVMASNPKTILFFATFLPQFMLAGVPLPVQFAVMAGTLVAVEAAVELALAGSAMRLRPALVRHARSFNRITGGCFVGIGGMVALTSRT